MTLTQKSDVNSACSGGNSTPVPVYKILCIVFMLCLQALDTFLNSSMEYNRYNFLVEDNDISTLWVLGLGLQLCIQVGIVVTLFAMMFDTYPFRVGLMGMVMSRFWGVGLISGIYAIGTMVIYGYRVQYLGNSTDDENSGNCEWCIWENTAYWIASIIQKFVACMFYASNLWAAFQLGRPVYQDRTYWMKRFKDSNTRGQA